MRLSLYRATRRSIPLNLAGVTIPWVRIPPSPFNVVDLQWSQWDFRSQCTPWCTRKQG